MYKVKRKDNKELYRIRDFTSGDKVDKSKFEEVINKKGEKQLQAQVYVLYQDEYTSLNQDIAPLKEEIEQLKSIIKDKDSQIETLETQVNEKEDIDVDEVKQIKEDKSNIEKELEQLKKTHANQVLNIYNDHNKENNEIKKEYDTKIEVLNDKLLSEVQANKQESDKLNDEILSLNKEKSKLEKTHLEDLKTIEINHAKEMRKLDKDNNDKLEHVRTTFLKLVTNENTQDIEEINAIAGDVPRLLKPFLRNHLTKLDELKERKQSHEPERIINTYELSGKKEKE